MNFFAPVGRHGDALVGGVVERHHDRLTGCQDLLGIDIFQDVFHDKTLGADARHTHANLDLLQQGHRGFVGDVDVGHDQSQAIKIHPVPLAQFHQVGRARLFNQDDGMGIIEMPLRVEITVTDLDRVVEVECCHK